MQTNLSALGMNGPTSEVLLESNNCKESNKKNLEEHIITTNRYAAIKFDSHL